MFGESHQITNRAVIEYPLGHPPERMPLSAVRAPDPRVIIFARDENQSASIRVAANDTSTAHRLAPKLEQTYRLHSDGLEFGYAGSGPADCALNILSLVLSPRESWRFHQKFKFAFVAGIDRDKGGTLALEDVRAWIAAEYETELADPKKLADEKEMRELLAEIEKEEREATEAGE